MKPNLILLHGALGSASQFQTIIPLLNDEFNTHTFNFSGHGGNNFTREKLSIELFANELEAFILEKNLSTPIHIFGYSMGGYVALYLASQKPNLLNSIITLATKFDWNVESSAKEAAMLNPEKIEIKIPAFAKQLQLQHQPNDWKILMKKTAEMLKDIGASPPLNENTFSKIKSKTKLMIGELDKMVSVDETNIAHTKILNSQFKILQRVEHPFEKADMKMLADEIKSFAI